jgi:hypothetical protein
MTEPERNESRALLTRAADLEGQRQAAQRARNLDCLRRIEAELRRTWARWAALERT